MGARQRAWAARARVALIEQLGAKCNLCGATEDLQFDHVCPRTWVAAKTDSAWRISIYRREAAAGLIQLLCGECNRMMGTPGVIRRAAR